LGGGVEKAFVPCRSERKLLFAPSAGAESEADQFNLYAGNFCPSKIDPLILDMDGDGCETISSKESEVLFDMDGDDFRESTE